MALICVICVAYEDQSETRFNKTTILILHSRWRPLLKARVLSQMWTYTTSLFNLLMITIKSNELIILSKNPLQRVSELSLESRSKGSGVDYRFWLWSWTAGIDKLLDMFVKFWPPHLLSRFCTFLQLVTLMRNLNGLFPLLLRRLQPCFPSWPAVSLSRDRDIIKRHL